MKELKEVFPKKLLKCFKNIYLTTDEEKFIALAEENDEPTVENFKVLLIICNRVKVITAEDFSYYAPEFHDMDFFYDADDEENSQYNYIARDAMPKNIVAFLDAAIQARDREAAEKENAAYDASHK